MSVNPHGKDAQAVELGPSICKLNALDEKGK